MLINRFKQLKGKKGVSLVEMLVAIVITSILSVVLSMMIVPVMNTYSRNKVKVELTEAVTTRLNDIALHLRGATGVYVSSSKSSFPEIRTTGAPKVQYDGVRWFDIKYGFALANYTSDYSSITTISGYLYPELKYADYSDTEHPRLMYASQMTPSMKLKSDDYQTTDIKCASNEDFYFYVRQNDDNAANYNALEVHLKLTKGDVSYEGTKTIVCENLVVNWEDIYTASFEWTGTYFKRTSATVSKGTDQSKWKKYYSVWFSKRD